MLRNYHEINWVRVCVGSNLRTNWLVLFNDHFSNNNNQKSDSWVHRMEWHRENVEKPIKMANNNIGFSYPLSFFQFIFQIQTNDKILNKSQTLSDGYVFAFWLFVWMWKRWKLKVTPPIPFTSTRLGNRMEPVWAAFLPFIVCVCFFGVDKISLQVDTFNCSTNATFTFILHIGKVCVKWIDKDIN